MLARRRAWLADKVCAECGEPDGLEIDHVDSSRKLAHRIWSWSRRRREAELAKCQPLCHQAKTLREMRARRAALTHCKRGHPFSGENLIIQRGNRLCRACRGMRRLAVAS
jgi:hypothetical protein